MSDAKNTKKATAKAKGDSKPNESATPSDTNKTQAAQIPQPGSESEQKGSADPEQENGNTDNTGQNGGEIASLDTQNQSGSAATKGADSESGENDLNNQDDDLSGIHDEQSAKEAIKGLIKEVIDENGGTVLTVEPKSVTEKRERIAKDVFANNTGLSVIFFTSDMMPFRTKSDALNHAFGLTNKKVTPINKED